MPGRQAYTGAVMLLVTQGDRREIKLGPNLCNLEQLLAEREGGKTVPGNRPGVSHS